MKSRTGFGYTVASLFKAFALLGTFAMVILAMIFVQEFCNYCLDQEKTVEYLKTCVRYDRFLFYSGAILFFIAYLWAWRYLLMQKTLRYWLWTTLVVMVTAGLYYLNSIVN